MEVDQVGMEVIGPGDRTLHCERATFLVEQHAITAAGAQILLAMRYVDDGMQYGDSKRLFYHDANATRIILNTIHYNSDDIPRDLDAKALHDIAVVASDARCVSILGGYGRVWLHRAMAKSTSLNELATLLFYADKFEMDDMYSLISQKLVCRNANMFVEVEEPSEDFNSWFEKSLLSTHPETLLFHLMLVLIPCSNRETSEQQRSPSAPNRDRDLGPV